MAPHLSKSSYIPGLTSISKFLFLSLLTLLHTHPTSGADLADLNTDHEITQQKIVIVTSSSIYDDSNYPTTQISCSDGSRGFLTKGFPNLGSIPSFPYLGAYEGVERWNSETCGKCFRLEYIENPRVGIPRTIWVQAVDGTGGDPKAGGWVLSPSAMEVLTGVKGGITTGTVRAYVEPVRDSWCPR